MLVESCWFCIANPKVEKHLICSIGSTLYMASAKGPVVPESSKGVPGLGHVLLIPITHYTTFNSIPAEEHQAVTQEVKKYIQGLRQLFNQYDCDLVSFEMSRGRAKLSHAHIQIVPIPKSKSASLASVAQKQADAQGFKLVDKPPVRKMMGGLVF